MSGYINNQRLFTEPETRQYGNHMVMTNVHKQNKIKYVNIDSKFRDEFYENSVSNKNADLASNQTGLSDFTITIPEKINEVKSLFVKNIELPMYFYNISLNLGNNYFKVTDSTNVEKIITLSDGNYTSSTLNTEIANKLTQAGLSNITITVSDTAKTTIESSSGTYTISFDINSDGASDKHRFRSKFGYILGFRKQIYEFTTLAIASEQLSNLNGMRYLYLAVDEYSKNNQNSFLTPLSSSFINKNVLARISLNQKDYPFGSILPANCENGYLISDRRVYASSDLQKLNIKLLDENGIPLDLNGADFSFCLEVEHS